MQTHVQSRPAPLASVIQIYRRESEPERLSGFVWEIKATLKFVLSTIWFRLALNVFLILKHIHKHIKVLDEGP